MNIKRENEEKREEIHDKYGVWHSCGDGWLHLTEVFMEQITNTIENHNRRADDDNQIEWPDKDKWIDIKEKYGALRISSGPWDEAVADELFAIESFVERLSETICESCGNTENVTHTPVTSWRKTICKDCLGEEAYRELEAND